METAEIQQLTDQIVQKLRAHYNPEKIILFGSYAGGSVQRNSGLDLLIIKDTKEGAIHRPLVNRPADSLRSLQKDRP